MDNETKKILLEYLLDSSSSSEESSSSSELDRLMSSDDSSSDENNASVSNFMKTIEDYSELGFKSHFRLNRSTVEKLIEKYSQSDFFSSRPNHGGKTKIEPRKEVYVYVWYVSNTLTFRQLGNLFGIATSSAWSVVGRVSSWLFSIGNEYIKWPQGDVIDQISHKFETKKKIPGIIGAIDCTHITIAAPKSNKEAYYNRKQNFTIVLQAVVDADKKFIDICVGEPGSLHDSRVLRRSALYNQAETNYSRLFPSNTFLLGDSAYASSNWIVPPFKDYGQLTDQQKSFNFIHSSTRMVVENAFGLLKGRFRRINKFTEQRTINSIKKIVVSVCILHNLCISNDDNITLDEEVTPQENNLGHNTNPELNTSRNRRETLFTYLCQTNII
ncbi:uncharacterized protein LOC129939620 [Eupeodes corollae]|uniref:uncharacterized protein LOC129939620 n=1 Tax=Eupeodes corollae TaxID=290404 RepID=UPI00248F9F48|nr:uncharacterized protein LOC129939620 [Eupeodes corollae]